jgi:hypothetical protein
METNTADLNREAAAALSVVVPEGGHELAEGLVMRPVTAGSGAICMMTGNAAYRALVENKPVDDIEDFELLAFLYIHCADLVKVRRAALTPATWKQAVLEWGEAIPFGVLVGTRAALKQSQEMLDAVKFDTEPKPTPAGHKEETPPPN